MVKNKKREARDVEKDYPVKQFVAKLRKLADCLEKGKRFRIQVAGERISIPPTATINIEHERRESQEEVEFQLKWSVGQRPAKVINDEPCPGELNTKD